MAKIYPFKGILYNQKEISNLTAVVAPPYDVISPQAQDRYYQNSDYNIIHLILGKIYPGDTESNNRYTRARDTLDKWLKAGILKRDEKPAVYFYQQDYSIFGKSHTRKGFVSLVRLEDFKDEVILPHEMTFSAAKQDRLNLLKATHANLSSIFAFYEDNNNTITGIINDYLTRKPIIDLEDEDRVRHKLWAISETGDIAKIKEDLEDKILFIADGHHRYETALNFRNEMKTKTGQFNKEEDYNRIMAYLVDINQAFTVLPTCRLIRGLKDMDMERIEKFFTIKTVEKKEISVQLEKEKGRHAFGMYYKGKYYLLVLKSISAVDRLMDPGEGEELKKLDVTILHKLLIEHILNIDDDKIDYVMGEDSSVELVDRGEYNLVFFLNPISKEEFKGAARAHCLMPKKTTYFYPKALSGLTINRFD